MVDIKELMRTYVALNDPNVKDITRKFGAVILGLGLASLAVWGAVAFFGEDSAPTQPQAETADENTETECVPEDEASDWRQENQDLILADKIESVHSEGDEVCYTYRTT